MSSEPNAAVVENASKIDGEGTHPQGCAASSPKFSTNAGTDLQDHDILLEQRATRDDPMHALPQEDARPNSRTSSSLPDDLPLPELSDPLTTEVPKPDGDPFEYFLKPMLERDNVQCKAWKDEVENILIFAGLFSAVVTAFIIESYQRLQPDPNDTIVGLLAHIAEKLDNPSINGTMSISSIVSDGNFIPSRPDVNINIFWFISLVLSLTAALIGIIGLQWLREHQRYDNTLKPRETIAIHHARLHSLRQWYVPQIFAGLPLLLQGALVLFFAGMIEFLFALRLEVAIPVTLAICIPLMFLVATTVLPMLQVCILQDAFRLSINNNVPSPCPYKSPQSLIFRRIGIQSKFVFNFFTSIIAGAYVYIIQIGCMIRKPADCQLPIFRTGRIDLKHRLCDEYPQSTRKIRDVSGDWTSIDWTWLEVRTIYAVSLQMAHQADSNLAQVRRKLPFDRSLGPEVYDCTRCFHEIMNQGRTDADNNAIYHYMETLSSWPILLVFYSEEDQRHASDLCVAFARFLGYDDNNLLLEPVTSGTDALVIDAMRDKYPVIPPGSLLHTTFMLSWLSVSDWYTWPTIRDVSDELATRLITNRLRISPERLFPMSSSGTWLPQAIFSHSKYRSWYCHEGKYSRSTTRVLFAFLETCSTTQLNLQLELRSAPATTNYGGISTYMEVVATSQHKDDIADTLECLTQLCDLTTESNCIHEKPFLMLAACFYLNAVATKGRHVLVGEKFVLFLKSILEACKITSDKYEEYHGWEGLNDAIDAIYHHHNPSQTTQFSTPPTDQPYHTISLASSLQT